MWVWTAWLNVGSGRESRATNVWSTTACHGGRSTGHRRVRHDRAGPRESQTRRRAVAAVVLVIPAGFLACDLFCRALHAQNHSQLTSLSGPSLPFAHPRPCTCRPLRPFSRFLFSQALLVGGLGGQACSCVGTKQIHGNIS